MTEIEQIAQEMDDLDYVTLVRLENWSKHLKSLALTHRFLSLSDLEQALDLERAAGVALQLALLVSPSDEWKMAEYHAKRQQARSLLGLPPAQET